MHQYRLGNTLIIVDEPTIIIFYNDNLSTELEIYATHHVDYYVNIRVTTKKFVFKEHYNKTTGKEINISYTGDKAEKRYKALKKMIHLLKKLHKLQVIQ